jgi:hypothetical protein
MSTFSSKDEIIAEFRRIAGLGWVKSVKKRRNDAGPGNTIEELLGISENNLPIPDAGTWELKAQRMRTQSLVTLFHTEPHPRDAYFVPRILLPLYGWKHKNAGKDYPPNEMSFRSTTYSHRYTDRGFKIIMNDDTKRIEFSFNAEKVSEKHYEWLEWVKERVGPLDEIDPQPHWDYDEIYTLAQLKIKNTFLVLCQHKYEGNHEYFEFDELYELTELSKDKFLDCIRNGIIAIDFDARTGHNHGTKFRIRRSNLTKLYDSVREIPIKGPTGLELYM